MHGKTINFKWVQNSILNDEDYTVLYNIHIDPIEIEYGWFVRGHDSEDFHDGKEVDILVEKVGNPAVNPSETVYITRDSSILRKLYKNSGIGTSYTLKRDYLLSYNRDENDISTLKY